MERERIVREAREKAAKEKEASENAEAMQGEGDSNAPLESGGGGDASEAGRVRETARNDPGDDKDDEEGEYGRFSGKGSRLGE